MTFEITKPGANRYAKCLVFGPPGQGKTHFLGTAQDDSRTSPMLLLDFEGGYETLAGLDIDIATIRTWDDFNEAYEYLSGEGGNGYKSVGIDSISEVHVWALLEILAEQAPRREGSDRRDPDMLEQGDYGKASTQMRRLLRLFRDLPLHVFYTATSQQVDERRVGRVAKPNMAGKMADEASGLMSVVGYLAIGEDEEGETIRELILQNVSGFQTKVRVPWEHEAPDTIEDPSVGALLDALSVEAPKKKTRKEN